MVEAQRLTRYYGANVGIEDASFSVPEGEIVGFLGPNGAGKTTTMRILAGILPPSSGRALVGGHDVVSGSLAVRGLVGYLPENPSLYPDMTVVEYLTFFGRVKGLHGSSLSRRLEEIGGVFHLESVWDRLTQRLSRGYTQRVGFAQAVISDPPVLILDEPTVGLDPKQIAEAREYIRSLRGCKTVLLSTHVLPEVSLLCEEVVIISDGRVRYAGPKVPSPSGATGSRAVLLGVRAIPGSSEVMEAIGALEGVANVEEVRRGDVPSPTRLKDEEQSHLYRVLCSTPGSRAGDLARAVVERGWMLTHLSMEVPTLEEMYLEITVGGGEESVGDPSTTSEV